MTSLMALALERSQLALSQDVILTAFAVSRERADVLKTDPALCQEIHVIVGRWRFAFIVRMQHCGRCKFEAARV